MARGRASSWVSTRLLVPPAVMHRPSARVLTREGVGADFIHDGAVRKSHRDATRVRLLGPVLQKERLACHLQAHTRRNPCELDSRA